MYLQNRNVHNETHVLNGLTGNRDLTWLQHTNVYIYIYTNMCIYMYAYVYIYI